MTEQQLRAAVAKYDAELTDAIIVSDEDGYMIEWQNGKPVTWYLFDGLIRRDEGCYSQESDVLISHAATMRAMDAAARAFEEALKK